MSVRALRRQRAFTLIEVLVALAIVVVGLAALFATISQSIRNSNYLRERTLAQWIALNKITETRLGGRAPSDDDMEGELEFANRKWRWKLETIATPVRGIVRLEASAAPEDAPEDSWPGQATGFMGEAIAPPGTPPPDWLGTATGQPGGSPNPGGRNDNERPPAEEPPGEETPSPTPGQPRS